MDLKNIWQQSNEDDRDLTKLLDSARLKNLQSKLPLGKLRQHLLYGMVWAVVITVGYGVIFVIFPIWQVHIALGVVIAFNLYVIVDSWKLYRKTPATILPTHSLKEELTFHYESFQRWWAMQQKISLFVYPVAAAGGFVLGGVSGSGKTVEEFLYNGKVLVALAIAVAILVPACYFLARWMFYYAYGKYIKQLKATLDELD
jgi:phosphoglycerol transferase MdoB-like AlkP superfamily enzyme